MSEVPACVVLDLHSNKNCQKLMSYVFNRATHLIIELLTTVHIDTYLYYTQSPHFHILDEVRY